MTTKTQPVWQHAVAHRLRGHLNPEDLDTACNNPFCTDPGCEGSCMVVGNDGYILQNLKGPRDPDACPRCWENPCYCDELFPEDLDTLCMQCYGEPCRCEPADGDDPLAYLDDPGYDDYFYPNRDFYDPESRADADGREYLEDSQWALGLAAMSPEERAAAVRQDRIDQLGFTPDTI